MRTKILLTCTLLVLAIGSAARAQLWTGNGANANWSTALNWSPSGAPVNNGTANLTFGGTTQLANNVDVAYSINSLTFNITAGAFNIGGSTITIGAGGITNNDGDLQTITAPINVNVAQIWSAAAGNLSITGVINGAGNLTKDGNGTLTLGGVSANGLSGAVTVNAGTLILAKPANVDAFTGALVIGDGAGSDIVQLNANQQTDNAAVIVNSSGTFNLNNFTEAISSLTVNGGTVTAGAGVLTTSSLSMTAGSISTTPGGAFFVLGNITTNASANSAVIGGWLDFNSATRTITIADGTAADDMDISAYIPNGGLTKAGAGSLRISGSQSNDAQGNFTVNAGTLVLAKSGSARAIGFNLVIGDGAGGTNADIVRLANHQQVNPSGNISLAASGLLDLNGFNQDITLLLFNGGNIQTNGGTLSLIGSGASFVTTAGVTATINGRLDLANGSRTFTVGDNTSLAIDADITAVITSATPALGALVKSGLGTLSLGGGSANTYTGPTNVNGGVLLLAKTFPDGAIQGDLIIGDNAGGAFDIVRLSAPNQIANTSNITFNRGGRLDMGGNSDTVNALTFTNGSGEVTGVGTLTIGGDVLANAGTSLNEILCDLNLGGGNRIFTIADGAASPDFEIIGNISNGTLEKQGPGELQLFGNNTAQISLGAGKLTLVNDNALGTLPAYFGDGTVVALFDRTIATPFFLVGNTTVDGTFALTFTGNFSGIGNLTKTGTGTLSFTAANTIQGDWTLNNGTLNGTALEVGTLGTFTQNGGTFIGTLDNRAVFTFNNGSFNGNLINDGTLVINNVIGMATSGMTNNTDITLAAGQTLSVFSPGLQNNGQITLNNSTLNLITSANNGIITGFGTITGFGGFTNNGLISQSGGNIILSNSTSQRNNGNIDLAPGRQMILQATPLDNRGTINLNGGSISGTAALQNNLGGTIAGRGAILSAFANNGGGTLRVQEGTLNIPSAFANSGTIAVAGVGSLVGGSLNNLGTIQGNGSIANDISNAGTIEAIGGTLALGGVISNNGTLAAPAGNKLLFSNGLSTNNSLINLTGGTFDNNFFQINNTGQISGFGIFRSGGLTNNGSITFTGGFTTINGNVTNAATRQIKIAYNPAIFTGNVTNNGIFKNTSTTVTFAGTYTENGTFISDPADNFFSSVSIGEKGAWVGGVGDRFFVSGDLVGPADFGELSRAVPDKSSWETSQAELHFTGGIRHLLSLLGDDRGVSFDGYDNNFAWGSLTLGASDQLTLGGDAGDALYVHELHLAGGLAQISSIAGNGHNIYYHLGDPANAYLGGQTYTLSGGGSLLPVPEPSTFVILTMFAGLIIGWRRPHAG